MLTYTDIKRILPEKLFLIYKYDFFGISKVSGFFEIYRGGELVAEGLTKSELIQYFENVKKEQYF